MSTWIPITTARRLPVPSWGWQSARPSSAKGSAAPGPLVSQKMSSGLRLQDPAPVSEWQSPQDPRAAITLDELMRMSSGLRFKEDYKNPRSDAIRMLLAEPDAGAYAAEKPLQVAPNSRWSYSSGTANIISRIVRQSVGGSLSDFFAFAHRALFDRVGMASAVIEPDPSGTFVGSSFMYATPPDWARFGLLYLNDGVWKNERILPEGWVKYSTTPTPNAPKGEYGAQFWLNGGGSGDPEDRWMPKVPPDMYSLRGFEGVSHKMPNCTVCHGENLKADGKHVITDKRIAPVSPAVNPERFTSYAKVEKWFKRNCTEVVGRECTAAEKADFIQFVIQGI